MKIDIVSLSAKNKQSCDYIANTERIKKITTWSWGKDKIS